MKACSDVLCNADARCATDAAADAHAAAAASQAVVTPLNEYPFLWSAVSICQHLVSTGICSVDPPQPSVQYLFSKVLKPLVFEQSGLFEFELQSSIPEVL